MFHAKTLVGPGMLDFSSKITKTKIEDCNYLFFLNPSANFPLVLFGDMNFCIADGTGLGIIIDGCPSRKKFLQKGHCL